MLVSLSPKSFEFYSHAIYLVLGFSGDFQHLSVYRDMNLYMNHLEQVTFQVNAGWGWFMFATNTLLTGSIIGRIMCVASH